MNKGIACALSFIFGVAAGAATCYIYVQKKYEKKYQEEVTAVREAFGARLDDINKAHWEVELTNEGDSERGPEIVVKTINDDIINRDDYEHPKSVDYTAYSSQSTSKQAEASKNIFTDKPYVIRPEEFGECGYTKIDLSYYADEVLAEFESDEIVDDIDEIVGRDSLKHIGECAPDVVYVRNDKLKCDYEITLDARYYSEATEGSYSY